MLKPTLSEAGTLLNYAIVLWLVFGSGLKQFSESHDLSHFLQEDVHCALCISSLNLDNGLGSSAPPVTIVINHQVAYIDGAVEYSPLQIVTFRNRGPPDIS